MATASSFSRLHDHTQLDTPHLIGLPWRVISPTQRPLPHNIQHSQETNVHVPAGIEPAIPESERLLAHALDRADRDLDMDTWSNHIPCGELVLWAILYNVCMCWARALSVTASQELLIRQAATTFWRTSSTNFVHSSATYCNALE